MSEEASKEKPPSPWLVNLAFPVAAFILGGIAMNWWNEKAPHLVFTPKVDFYDIGKADANEFAKAGLVRVSIKNDGARKATNVVCTFQASGEIEKTITVPDIANANIETKANRVIVTVPIVHAGQTVDISTYLKSPRGTPSVSVQSDEVLGTEQPAPSPSDGFILALGLVVSFIVGIVIGDYFRLWRLQAKA